MNSLLVALIGIIFFIVSYRIYGKFLENLFGIDPSIKTPAVKFNDGIDYIPAKHWTVLFGHHFSSIAGAGPILGPVLAAATWGWFPAFLWIVLGSIFVGAVHDFSSLVVSLRHNGHSIADVAENVISIRAKMLFSGFVWLALILVVAVFASTTATTLVNEPRIVIPTFGLIFVAILVGRIIYSGGETGRNISLPVATIFGVILLITLLFIGYYVPVDLKVILQKVFSIEEKNAFNIALNIWIIALLIYSYIASVLPVNIILQPRDYLSTFILFFGLICGYLGLIFNRPQINTPMFLGWTTKQGPLLPMLFVFIACGAVSGFHSLISSGTTSKQLDNERNALKIGYGAMLLEGALAILALLTVTAGLLWEKKGGINCPVYPELLKTGNWIGTFSAGYGQIVSKVLGITFGCLVATITLNSFVMTTLDTATRITRYITEEFLGKGFKIQLFTNRFFSTAIIIFFAGYLAFGNWKAIWPVFGASNQLVAALALFVVSLWLINQKKNFFVSAFPGIFMFLVTFSALVYQAFGFFSQKNALLFVISIILIFLSLFILFEVYSFLKNRSK
ncbi:MAG: carbon starvation protein A [Endomicrobiia bacterium]